jgi:hypothetical protein
MGQNLRTLFLVMIGLLVGVSSYAQYMGAGVGASAYVGGGAYFGMNTAGCGAGANGGQGGIKVPANIARTEKRQISLGKQRYKLQEKIDKANDTIAEYGDKIQDSETNVKSCLKSTAGENIAAAAINHIKYPPSEVAEATVDYCFEVETSTTANTTKNYKKDSKGNFVIIKGLKLPWADFCKMQKNNDDSNSFAFSSLAAGWKNIALTDGNLNIDSEGICRSPLYVAKPGQGTTAPDCAPDCERGLKDLIEAYPKKSQAEQDIKDAEARIAAIDKELEMLDERKDRDVSRLQDKLAEGKGGTAAGVCYSCQHQYDQPISTTDKILGLTGTALNVGLMYAGTKAILRQNEQMGWQTNPWLTYGMAYPFVMQGIYGLTSGGGSGAYSCSPGYNGGGNPAFGYPGYQGYNPWGGVNSGMPGYMGNGMPGYMGNVGAIGNIGAMPGYMGNGMPGYMGNGMPGYIGNVGAIGNIGAMPGYMGNGMPGYMGNGMPGYMGSNGMPGYMGSNGMPGYMGNNGMASAQYQMQMAQMYQQQMQSWMSQQQSMMQDYSNRQQMIGRLQTELANIQMQIQMISSGATTTSFGSTGTNGGTLVPTGNVFDPNANSNNPTSGRGRGN